MKRVIAGVVVLGVTMVASALPSGAQEDAGLKRLAGRDRYETAAAISQQYFSSASTVVLAPGERFPDALAATPVAAAVGAPVLLAARDSLSGATRAELERLAPSEIIVVGGEGAIGDDVYRELADLGSPRRVAGPDRYATAAQIATTFFDAAETVVVASGESFADALAAGAFAARENAPLLLTARAALPGATESAVSQLAPARVVVVGGLSAVSAAVADSLERYAPVTRIAGADRYATAALLGSATADRTFIASGSSFPDALAAGAAAAREGQVLLASGPCLTTVTIDAIRGETVVVGGRSSVSPPAADAVECPRHSWIDLRFDAGATDVEISSIYAEAVEAQRLLGDGGPVVLTVHDTDFGPVPDGRSGTPGVGGWLMIDIYLPSYRQHAPHQLGIVTHEAAHTVQFWRARDDARLSGAPPKIGSAGIVPIWLVEGGAQSVTDHVLGRGPVDKHCPTSARLEELIRYEDYNHPDRDGRGCLGEVAVDYLTSRVGFEAVVHGYWTELAGTMDWTVAFERAFGMTAAAFYEDFEAYRAS